MNFSVCQLLVIYWEKDGRTINDLKGTDDFMSLLYDMNGNIDIVFHNVENIFDKFPFEES